MSQDIHIVDHNENHYGIRVVTCIQSIRHSNSRKDGPNDIGSERYSIYQD